MGDINFNITKDVNLNKVVNLDIDKNVDVNVNVDDLLATAEADAEVFGEEGLAEVDAYTYVNEGNGSVCEDNPGEVDVLGNITPLDLGDDNDGDGAVDTIGINFTPPPLVTLPDGTVIPDVDDINGFDALSNLNAPPPDDLPDSPIPQPLLSITDLNLTQTGSNVIDLDGDGDIDEAEYSSDADWVVDFGVRTIHCDQFGEDFESNLDPITGQLTLTVPEGSLYLAEFLENGEVELEFESGDPFFTLEGQVFDTTGFSFVADSLETIIGDYAFEASAIFGQCCVGDNGGEAFAYAESTSAVDLNGDGDIIPTVEAEI